MYNMQKHTIQTLLAEHLKPILRQRKFPLHQLKALENFSQCRTASLGGNAQYCKNGHLNGIWYNSCHHRACPQCQSLASEQWLVDTQRVLLDCPHHHIVFTLAAELNPLFQYNRAIMMDILFKASQETLVEFAADQRYLDAMLAMIASLHTWGRNLSLHPHVHFLVSHGGLDANGQWRSPKRDCLFPGKPVMKVYRAKFLSYLRKAIKQADWVMPQSMTAADLKLLLNRAYKKEWVVYFCDRYDYASGVAKYLSRYVKSGPMRNNQLHASKPNWVKFSYQSHQTGRREYLSLRVIDFVQRFIQHVPPAGKRLVRYYGLYHPNTRTKLDQARAKLAMAPVGKKQVITWQHFMDRIAQTPVCSICGEPVGPEIREADVQQAA